MKKAFITGVSGFLGGGIALAFERAGWTVVELGRKPCGPDREWIRWSLNEPVSIKEVSSTDTTALVHCAYDFSLVQWDEIRQTNVLGSQKLIASAVAAGVQRVIFISSISAFPSCRSLYGKAKMEIEEGVLQAGGTVIRPGLIWGGADSGGMFNSLRRAASRSAFVPLVGDGSYPQYLVHQDDLCDVLLEIADERISPDRPLTLAHSQPWPLRRLVSRLAELAGRQARTVPIPWRLLWIASKTGEVMGISLPFRSDSIVSLVYQDQTPDFSVVANLGINPRSFS